MNKKFMIGGCAAVAIAGNVFAGDEDISYFAPYASLKGGYAYLSKRNDIKYKGGFAGAFELGVSYDDAWRLGLELGYKSNKIKNFKLPGGFEGTNYILNGGYDLAAAGNAMEQRSANSAAAYAAALVAIGNKSVFEFYNNNFDAANGVADVFGMSVADTHDGLGLKNVRYLKLEKMSALTGMVNVFYDYAMTDAWSIYAGVGLGVARVNVTALTAKSERAKKIADKAHAAAYTAAQAKAAVLEALPKYFEANEISKTELSKTVFAWQLMAGVGYEFNENWKLTLGYKLFNTAKVKQTFAGKEYKIKTPFNHTAEVGLTYSF